MRLRHTALAAMTVFTAATTDLAAQAKSDSTTTKSTVDTQVPHYIENKMPYACLDQQRLKDDIETGRYTEDHPILMIYLLKNGQFVTANIIKDTEDEIRDYADSLTLKEPERIIRVHQQPGRLVGLIWHSEVVAHELQKPRKMRDYMNDYQRNRWQVISQPATEKPDDIIVPTTFALPR